MNSGVAYMLGYLSDSTTSTTSATIGSAIQDAFQNGGAAAVTALLDGNYSWNPSAAGTYSDTTKAVDPVDDLGFTAGSKYNVYAVVFDTDTITENSKFFVTKELANKTVPASTANLLLSFGTMATASQADGAWTSVNVPEPTTVALLALGLAAVGLKRKVA